MGSRRNPRPGRGTPWRRIRHPGRAPDRQRSAAAHLSTGCQLRQCRARRWPGHRAGGRPGAGPVRRRIAGTGRLSPAHRLARRRAGHRRPVCVRPATQRLRPASDQRRPSPAVGRCARRQRNRSRWRARHALCGVGAQRHARGGGGRFQQLGRAPASDAVAAPVRRVGAVRARRRSGRALQVPATRPAWERVVGQGRPGGAACRAGAGHRLHRGRPHPAPVER